MSAEPEDDEVAAKEPSDDAAQDAFATTSDVQTIAPQPGGESTTTTFGYALALTAVVSAAFHFALSPEMRAKSAPFAIIGGVYATFAVLTVLRLRRTRNLATLGPKGGDISVAALVAGGLWGLGYAASKLVMSAGSPREGWLVNVYLLLGNPGAPTNYGTSIALFFVGGAEELAWRGLVLDSLEGKLGALRAALVTSALWAFAHVPTIYRLGDELSGYNPLLVAAAFGCGLVWSFLRYRTGRLFPAVISHAIFSWAVVQFPLWRP